jgi:hypothetical protein
MLEYFMVENEIGPSEQGKIQELMPIPTTTLERQVEVWAFSHPQPRKTFAIYAGIGESPYTFNRKVNDEPGETGAKVVIAIIAATPGGNEAFIAEYQRQIEENLTSELPEDGWYYSEGAKIAAKYFPKLRNIYGATSLSPIQRGRRDYRESLVISLKNPALAGKLPAQLEDLPLRVLKEPATLSES